MKKNGDSHLAGKKLGMGDLYLHTLGTRLEGWQNCVILFILCITLTGAHRAFPDVVAMEAVMTHQSLISCLPNLPVRSAKKQMELWTSQKQRFHQAQWRRVHGVPWPPLTLEGLMTSASYLSVFVAIVIWFNDCTCCFDVSTTKGVFRLA